MDTRVELLDAFYQTMRRDKVKIENKNYGFDFINGLTADDVILDYVQMENNFIHKYRLLNISEQRRKILMQGHVNQEYNVCLYFDERANNTFCFNFDNNLKINNNQIIPELGIAVDYLQQHLGKYGIETISVKSGRGYHQWCRLAKPIANQLLLDFMIRIAAKTLASLHYNNHDYRAIKINMNPNPQFVNNLSLRAFGSRHIKTGKFTHIETKEGALNEEDSWKHFSNYIINKTISKQQFKLAYDDLVKSIPL